MTNLFKVEGQTLTPLAIYEAVSDTVNYLTFAFSFDSEWDGLTKSAIFTQGASVFEVVLTSDAITADDHVNLSAGVWEISVVGDTVVDAVVTRQITTSSYNYTVAQSGATSGGVFPPSVASQVYINTNQATPQTFVGGIPKLTADRVIDLDNELADKKYVDDKVATVTADDFAHNSLSSLQGGGATERYHMTQAENTALHAHSNKTALDAVSGTNTGDQDVYGAISTHNTDAGAHAGLARKSETMRLLISRTIGAGENVSVITWTQDDAGNALALIDADIRVYILANSIAVGASGDVFLRINNKSGANDYHLGTSRASSCMRCGIFRTGYGKMIALLRKMNGLYLGTYSYSADDGTTLVQSVTTQGSTFQSVAISAIYISISGITYFPTGTIIEIYGRTA